MFIMENIENEVARRKSKITKWKPTQKDIIVSNDGKIFLFYFEKLFSPKMAIYDRFYIKKSSYEKQLETICRYINFFLYFYDKEKELPVAYLKIKYALDKEKLFTEENPEQLIDLIYEVLFTDSMQQKIRLLVEENYLDDIESDDSKKYANKEKKHLESLEFTNQHIKILLRISFGMKIISPILFHYVSLNVIKLDKDSDLIYNFYKRLFDIFSDDVNMYNKLFVYVNFCQWRRR